MGKIIQYISIIAVLVIMYFILKTGVEDKIYIKQNCEETNLVVQVQGHNKTVYKCKKETK